MMKSGTCYARRPARTSQAERRSSWQVVSDVQLETPGFRRTIGVRTFAHDEPQIEIAVTKDGAPAGIRIITQSALGPLKEATALALDAAHSGMRATGRFAIRSGVELSFFACRNRDQPSFVKIVMTNPTGDRRGRAVVISGAELDALSRAALALSHLPAAMNTRAT